MIPALLLLGLGLRICVAVVVGSTGDTEAFDLAGRALPAHGVHLYAHVQGAGAYSHGYYAYPAGYLPFLWLESTLSQHAHHVTIYFRALPVLADLALAAWLATLLRGRKGQWLAVCLVALGPTLVVSSSIEAQLDVIAILPTVLAVLTWQREGRRRDIFAGLLIGLGASIKTVPLLMVFALLPTARSHRERWRLICVAVAVPVVLTMPFFVAEPRSTFQSLKYAGYPGGGGLGLLLQPRLGRHYLGDYDLSGANSVLQTWGWVITLLAVAAACIFVSRRGVRPLPAAVLLWLTLLVSSVNFYPQYLNWIVPFALLAGWGFPALSAELVMGAVLLLYYRSLTGVASSLVPTGREAAILFVSLMDVLWVAGITALLLMVRRARGNARSVVA